MQAEIQRGRRILIIGIGAGNPDYITVQAINALRQAKVIFITDKGPDAEDLARARTEVCARYLAENSYRIVAIQDPERDRSAADYRSAVQAWHETRALKYEALISETLGEDDCGAFLVWGDPALYDSTLRIIGQIAARKRVTFEYEVIPGISSIQALAARHRIALNRIGEPVQITTGRQLSQEPGLPAGDAVVMLDAECAFKHVKDPDVEIFWGAYLGTPDEILLSGKLAEVSGEIERVRAEARQRKGWIMDTYLLRRPPTKRDRQ